MNAARAIRWSTVAAVAVVALVAAFVSYRHALQVVREHGETGPVALAYPLTIDGLIYAASMVLLDSARRRVRAPVLAYVALGAGIGATVAVNVAAGMAYGPLGAVVAAWPAPALVISYELLMLVIRSAVPGEPEPVPERQHEGFADGERAAGLFAAELSGGKVPSIRAIKSALSVGQPKASEVRAYLETLTVPGAGDAI